MHITSMIATFLQLFISFATALTMLYTFAKFTQKPTDSLKEHVADIEERLNNMDKWKEQIERRLTEGAEHFKSLDESNKVTQRALLAIMDNALGNDGGKEELKKARDMLNEHLTNS